jgi:hypothetical protein
MNDFAQIIGINEENCTKLSSVHSRMPYKDLQ